MLSLLKRFRELLLVAVLLVVPLAIFFAQAKKPSERSRAAELVVWATSPIERGIAWAVGGSLDLWRGYVNLRGAHARAGELSRRVNELELERQELLAERHEVERLRQLLSFVEAGPARAYVGARVIGVRLAPTGLQLVTVDRGARDGLERQMAVVVAGGVVGRVHAVRDRTADVLLVTDRNSSVAVQVERSRARANVRGTGKPDAARLDYALRTEDLVEGDALVTSGTDGVFPRGLPVGTVTQLRKSGNGLFQEAVVIPAVDVTRIEEVLVVTAAGTTESLQPAAFAPGSP